MKKIKLKKFYALITASLCVNLASSQNFTWMKGPNIADQNPVYGSLGVSASANNPGGREAAMSWKDALGNFWLFGGIGYDAQGSYDLLNDLWKYTPSNNQWTWISGDSIIDQNGVYGTMGVAAATNKPGSRLAPTGWTDASGNLWMFGGSGMDAFSNTAELSDLWKYNVATNQWTWVNGSNMAAQSATFGTLGVSSSANEPGARYGAQGWLDASGNFWMFGGLGYDASTVSSFLSDLWKYNPLNNQWTWMHGNNTVDQPGVYGTIGVAASSNMPGGRILQMGWADASGNLWMFGGLGLDNSAFNIDALNDLWRYNISSNQWTWIKGSNTIDQPGVYGSMGTPAAANTPGARYGSVTWKDNSGDIWLFGGIGMDSLATSITDYMQDLWRYNPASNQWTWTKGTAMQSAPGTYGTQGVASSFNIPGSRAFMNGWTDGSNNLWLFGGSGVDGSTGFGELSDLWKMNMCVAQSLTVTTTNTVTCAGTTVTLTVSGASTYTWSTTQTVSVITVTPNANTTYTVFSTNSNGCGNVATIQQSVNPHPTFTLTSSSSFSNCQGAPSTVTLTGADTYSWSSGQTGSVVVLTPTTTTSYTIEGISNGCNTFIPFVQTVLNNPTLTLSSSSNTVCIGASATLSVTGASSYSWHTTPGSSNSTVAVSPTLTTTYTVTGTNSDGCKDTKSFTQVISQCLGVNEFKDESSRFKVYPNPNNGEFNINGVNEGTKLIIVNSLGQKVFEKELDQAPVKTELAKGVYHYQLIQQDTKTAFGKIVIE